MPEEPGIYREHGPGFRKDVYNYLYKQDDFVPIELLDARWLDLEKEFYRRGEPYDPTQDIMWEKVRSRNLDAIDQEFVTGWDLYFAKYKSPYYPYGSKEELAAAVWRTKQSFTAWDYDETLFVETTGVVPTPTPKYGTVERHHIKTHTYPIKLTNNYTGPGALRRSAIKRANPRWYIHPTDSVEEMFGDIQYPRDFYAGVIPKSILRAKTPEQVGQAIRRYVSIMYRWMPNASRLLFDFWDFLMKYVKYVLGSQLVMMHYTGMYCFSNFIAMYPEEWNFAFGASEKYKFAAELNMNFVELMQVPSFVIGQARPFMLFAEANLATADIFRSVTGRNWDMDEKQRLTANLYLTSTPSDADIFLGDWQSGRLTPHLFKYLNPGWITINLTRYDPIEKTWLQIKRIVEIEPGKTNRIHIDFTRYDEILHTKLVVVRKVIDGDTIEVFYHGFVRYISIDTPEKGEVFFEEAKQRNLELIRDQEILLELDSRKKDKYRRLLAHVFTVEDGVKRVYINEKLIEEGLAEFSPRSPNWKYADRLREAEKRAKEAKRGIWGVSKNDVSMLRLVSTPSNAQIFIDGERTGYFTPWNITRLTPGKHIVKVTKEHGKIDAVGEAITEVDLKPGERRELMMILDYPELPEFCTLSVKSSPSNAKIFIDEVDTGYKTPKTFKDMLPGEFKIRCEKVMK